jgi:RNA polymerase sigma factor FliA
MRAKGDDRLVEQHRGLVEGLARKVRAELDLRCELDDLVAYGLTGLLQAQERFDPSRGVQFQTFAYYRIRGAILDGVRRMAFLPRSAHRRMRLAEATDAVTEPLADARAAHPEARSPDAAAEALGDALGKITAAYTLSALGQDTEQPAEGPDEALMAAEVGERVRQAVQTLPGRERALVEGFYFQGRRFDEVAAELGISKSWASRLHGKALAQLRAALEDDGATGPPEGR